MSESTRFEISPYCAELRTKKWALSRRPPRDDKELMDGSQHCWCSLTMESVGPDAQIVDPDDCRVGRSCFRSYSQV